MKVETEGWGIERRREVDFDIGRVKAAPGSLLRWTLEG